MTDLPSFLDTLPLARRALEYAAGRHEGQVRESDAAPFIAARFGGEVASLVGP